MEMSKNKKKLIIEIARDEKELGCVIRVDKKANALLDDIAKRSGRNKQYIASRMIEFAYDFIEYVEPEEETENE